MTHLFDNDFYKFLMQQFLLAYPQFDVPVEYTFTLRKPEGVVFNDYFKNRFSAYLGNFKYDMQLLTPKEASYLNTVPGMKSWYVDWLRSYKPDEKNVSWQVKDGALTLKVKAERWSEAIWWEVPLLATISECYNLSFANPTNGDLLANDLHYRLNSCNQADHKRFYGLGNAQVVEFGTRRRFSADNQERVLEILRQYPCYAGTSNVLLAMQNGEKPLGTMAHELFMGIAPQVGYDKVYEVVLNRWYELYAPHHLIALPDTFTSKHFFDNVPDSILYMYDGVRQDSGTEADFSQTYESNLYGAGVKDVSKKKIIYSNGLTSNRISVINGWSRFRTQKSFGWGTELTNHVGAEVPTAKALNMVIKLTSVSVNDREVRTVKISDDPGKAMGPQETIDSILEPKGTSV